MASALSSRALERWVKDNYVLHGNILALNVRALSDILVDILKQSGVTSTRARTSVTAALAKASHMVVMMIAKGLMFISCCAHVIALLKLCH